MSTRSRVGILYQDGSVRSIYVHYDGYPSGVGQYLIDGWTDLDNIEALMEGGDRPSVAPTSLITDTYRARGDESTEALAHDTLAEFEADYARDLFIEWTYLFVVDSGTWVTRASAWVRDGEPQPDLGPWLPVTPENIEMLMGEED